MIDKQAIIGFLAGEANEDDTRRLAEWRAADPANEREFQRIYQLWMAVGDFSKSPKRDR
jgi:ferric-dicitrate binding protein FerR (iron transport regulator)